MYIYMYRKFYDRYMLIKDLSTESLELCFGNVSLK